MKKVPFKMIEVTTWKGSQSVNFRKLAQLGDHKIKIEIQRDSYANQSFARGYVFSVAKMEWSQIYSVPYPQMKTKEGIMYGQEQITATMFHQDSEAVMAGITSILF